MRGYLREFLVAIGENKTVSEALGSQKRSIFGKNEARDATIGMYVTKRIRDGLEQEEAAYEAMERFGIERDVSTILKIYRRYSPILRHGIPDFLEKIPEIRFTKDEYREALDRLKVKTPKK